MRTSPPEGRFVDWIPVLVLQGNEFQVDTICWCTCYHLQVGPLPGWVFSLALLCSHSAGTVGLTELEKALTEQSHFRLVFATVAAFT